MIQIQAGMPTSYQQHLKDQNVTLLFDLVRRRVPISRAELTKTPDCRRRPLHPATKRSQSACKAMAWIYAA